MGCLVISLTHATCQHAHRIIALAPNLTELVFTAGAGDSLIAVDESSDYPVAATALPKVANYRDIDIERILSLHPDLIVAWSGGNPQLQLDQLKKLGLTVQEFDFRQLLDIPSAIEKIGCLTGHEQTANQQAQTFRAVYQAEKNRVKRRPPVTVFFELSNQPLLTLTQHSLVNDMITTCGGQNIFANTWGIAPEVSVEAVIKARPQVMVGTVPGWQASWLPWQVIPAVKTKQLFTVDPDYVVRATYRSLLGLQAICLNISR